MILYFGIQTCKDLITYLLDEEYPDIGEDASTPVHEAPETVIQGTI